VALATIVPKTDPDEISKGVEQLLDVIVPVATLAIGLLGLFGAPALTLLYSSKFAPGAGLFPYILNANLLLVVVWVLGAPQLSRGHRLLWLFVEALHAGVRWAVALWLIPRWGSTAVAIAYLAGVGVQFLVNLALFHLLYRLRLNSRHLVGVGVGAGIVSLLSAVGAHVDWVSPWHLAALAVWVAYGAYHARRTHLVELVMRRVRGGG
jgi:O-antigen/teichoic acid export membrane protein